MSKRKKKTRLDKSMEIVSGLKYGDLKWCYVNTENEFMFMNRIYVIDDSVEEYKVFNKSGIVDDYTNEAYMEEVLATVNPNGEFNFYNQNYDLINKKFIKIKE